MWEGRESGGDGGSLVTLGQFEAAHSAAEALNNKDLKLFNSIANVIKEQTGQAAPTEFEAVKRIVADEIVKSIIGGVTALGDRAEAAATISRANSPEQLMGVIGRYKELIGGQMKGLESQYINGTGKTKEDFRSRLFPAAAAMLDKATEKQDGARTNSKGWKMMTDKNGNKAYVSPDGKSFEEVK